MSLALQLPDGATLEAMPARYVEAKQGFSIQPPPGWKVVPGHHSNISFGPSRDKVLLTITANTIPGQNAHAFLRQVALTMGVRIQRALPINRQTLRTLGADEGLRATFVAEENEIKKQFEEIWILRKKNRIYTIVVDGEPDVRSTRRDEIRKAVLSFRILWRK
ncbi:MAG: hypothetical protein K8S54_04850 [Spirochaetia bacterium]|nr:hypothetical protein [Spirochaetia bacterium]